MVTEYHTGPRRNIFSSLYNNCDIAGQAKPSHDKPVVAIRWRMGKGIKNSPQVTMLTIMISKIKPR
jgi:hypothetical protein